MLDIYIQKLINYNISVMLLLDSFLFLIVVGALHLIKFKYPNFLFFCKGAVMFLAPDQSPKPQKPPKKKAQKPQIEVRVVQLQYQHVKQNPKCQQYDRTALLLTSMLIYLPLKYILSLILLKLQLVEPTTLSTTFSFILLLVMVIYTMKIGLEILWISSYNLKYCFGVGIGINLLYFLFYLSTRGLGVYDPGLGWAIQDYQKLLTIVFGSGTFDTGAFDVQHVLIFVLVINTVFTLVSIPAVIKFGNWYTKTLKQLYYQDPETSQIKDPQSRKQQQKKQQNLKTQTKKTIRLLNLYLISILIFLFLSHNYSKTLINPIVIDFFRTILMSVVIFVNCFTLKDAIEFNGSFAYRYIEEWVEEEDAEKRGYLRKRILQFLYYVWYHKFQLMFRVIVPLILFMVLMDWKYLHANDRPLEGPPVIAQSHCGVQTSHLNILQNLYKCDPISSTSHIHQLSQPFINGVLVAGKSTQETFKIQDRIQKYGLLNSYFMTELAQQLLWYSNITVYAMTIIYILFLRKTVYEI